MVLLPLIVPWAESEEIFYLIPGDHRDVLNREDNNFGEPELVTYEDETYTSAFGSIEHILALAKHLDLSYFLSYNSGQLSRFSKSDDYLRKTVGDLDVVFGEESET